MLKHFVDIESLENQFDTKLQILILDEEGLRAEDEFPPEDDFDQFFE